MTAGSPTPTPAARLLRAPGRYWARQSLRARLTLLATALFALAVATGAVLVVQLQRYALIRVLDASAGKTATALARTVRNQPGLSTVTLPTGGAAFVQVVDARDLPLATSPGAERYHSYVTPAQLAEVRRGTHLEVLAENQRVRVVGATAGSKTVLVYTDLGRVDDSVRVLTRVALIGAPIAVLLLGLSSYFVVALTLRSVAALRHGAANISRNAAGVTQLAGQRLPVPTAQDEIQRLAITLNAMLDRIESSTSRQRTFVGDAAHELRSPLASLRVQLEVAQRMGPSGDWPGLIDDVLIDVARLDKLVEDLLSLARLDEMGGQVRHVPVGLAELATTVVGRYGHARVPVTMGPSASGSAAGSEVREAEVSGDPDALQRVIVNLVDNAVRYARTGVTVDLRLDTRATGRGGNGSGPNGSGPHGRAANGRIVLTVTDDGPGLPEDERERVFDRFYRAEMSRSRDSGGTGLGLPIVRDLVRAHRGSVRLQARPDGEPGLQAVVVLPRA